MDNKVWHAVLKAFGIGISIKDGLETDSIYGKIHAVQRGNSLLVFIAEPKYMHVDFAPRLEIHNVAHLDDYVITATIQLMFRT